MSIRGRHRILAWDGCGASNTVAGGFGCNRYRYPCPDNYFGYFTTAGGPWGRSLGPADTKSTQGKVAQANPSTSVLRLAGSRLPTQPLLLLLLLPVVLLFPTPCNSSKQQGRRHSSSCFYTALSCWIFFAGIHPGLFPVLVDRLTLLARATRFRPPCASIPCLWALQSQPFILELAFGLSKLERSGSQGHSRTRARPATATSPAAPPFHRRTHPSPWICSASRALL